MIEIQVSGLVKSFEVGRNVLDGLTFQIDQGERVGLLGRNGAGKTTLFRILTGELEPDEGTVTIGQGRRVGLISQIPVYPAGFTVEDVLRSAFSRLLRRGAAPVSGPGFGAEAAASGRGRVPQRGHHAL